MGRRTSATPARRTRKTTASRRAHSHTRRTRTRPSGSGPGERPTQPEGPTHQGAETHSTGPLVENMLDAQAPACAAGNLENPCPTDIASSPSCSEPPAWPHCPPRPTQRNPSRPHGWPSPRRAQVSETSTPTATTTDERSLELRRTRPCSLHTTARPSSFGSVSTSPHSPQPGPAFVPTAGDC